MWAFNIVTNIGRTQQGVRNDRAGFDFISALTEGPGVQPQDIGVFCSPQNPYLSEAQQMSSISAFVSNHGAVQFASFGEATKFTESDATTESTCAIM
jgi:hypothetical protein